MDPLLIGKPPAANKRVDELHIWIAIQPDGGEGIMATDLPYGLPGHIRHLPLMSSNRDTAEAMSDVAHQVQAHAAQQGQFITIQLRTYIRKPASGPLAPPRGEG